MVLWWFKNVTCPLFYTEVMGLHLPPPECGLHFVTCFYQVEYGRHYGMSLLRLNYKKTIVFTLIVPFPPISPPLFPSLILLDVGEVSYHVLRLLWQLASNSLPATACLSLEWILPQSDFLMTADFIDPQPEPPSYAAYRFLTHKNCD